MIINLAISLVKLQCPFFGLEWHSVQQVLILLQNFYVVRLHLLTLVLKGQQQFYLHFPLLLHDHHSLRNYFVKLFELISSYALV